MAKIETAALLAAKCKAVAQEHKTLYVLGAFGWPMNQANKTRAMNEQVYNRKAARKAKLNAAGADTFGFDCVCLVKALLWGWEGDKSKAYGGAQYCANGVPDIGADRMIGVCKEVSRDFTGIQVGEAVWCSGHIGIYIGDGLAVECTHRWKDGVQITAVHNIGTKAGYNGRKWTKHGKLPWVTYAKTGKTVDELAQEVLDGKHGNGDARKKSLGELYGAVQQRVNEMLKETSQKVAVDYARNMTKALAGTYRVNSRIGLKLRAGADTGKAILETMPDGSVFTCYGYHTGDWLFGVSASGKTGFCHKSGLVKEVAT